MKSGLTVDSEGEVIDYNKVDTALKSVGISIKDSQHQFREFDDVIFELSEKWDTLDKNTQRYIATIMAGNRQQSRFIALVSNNERLKEVMAAAENSEDAGLLQYAKTLDSLETKLSALSTSFQQFYMNIVDGNTFKGLLDIITKILNGLNSIGSASTILTGVTLIKAIKGLSYFVINNWLRTFSEIRSIYTTNQKTMTNIFKQELEKRFCLEKYYEDLKLGKHRRKPLDGDESDSQKFLRTGIYQVADIASAIAAALGTYLVGNGKEEIGASLMAAGNIVSAGTTGGRIGRAIGSVVPVITPKMGELIGAGIAASLAAFFSQKDLFNLGITSKERAAQKAKEIASNKNLERATIAEEERNLKSTIDNLEKLQKVRYQSEEAERAYLEASEEAASKFPQLRAEFKDTGEIYVDVLSDAKYYEEVLAEARRKTAEATADAAAAEYDQAKKEQIATESRYNYLFEGFKSNLIRIFEDNATSLLLDAIYTPIVNSLHEAASFDEVKTILEKAKVDNKTQVSNIDSFVNTAALLALASLNVKPKEGETSFETMVQEITKLNIENSERKANVASERAKVIESSLEEYGLEPFEYKVLSEYLNNQAGIGEQIKDDKLILNEEQRKTIDSFKNLEYNKEDTKKLIELADRGSITTSYLKEQLQGIFGKDNEIINNYIETKTAETSERIKRIVNELVGHEDIDNTYINDLEEIPFQYYYLINQYNNYLKEIGQTGKKGSDSLSNLIDILKTASSEELALYAEADFTSFTGINTIIDSIRKSDIKNKEERISAWDNFTPISPNLITDLETYKENVVSTYTAFNEQISKAVNGLNLEEALKLSSVRGLDINNDFKQIGDKLYLTNVEALYNSIFESIDGLGERVKTAAFESNDKDAIEMAQTVIDEIDHYKQMLYTQILLSNGFIDEAITEILSASPGLDTLSNRKQLSDALLSGNIESLDSTLRELISPYVATINNSVIDSIESTWRTIASNFGTDAIITANNNNITLLEKLANGDNSILETIGEGSYKVRDDVTLEDIQKAASDTNYKLYNDIISSYNNITKAAYNAVSEIITNTDNVSYSSVVNLANAKGLTITETIDTYFEEVEEGISYKVKDIERLLLASGDPATLKRTLDIQEGKRQENIDDFLKRLTKDTSWEELEKAQELGLIKITDDIIKKVKEETTTVYELIAEIYSSNNLIRTSKIVNKDKANTDLNKTFNSIFDKLTEVSVEEMQKLYEDITGKDLDSETAEKYYQAIKLAKEGNVDILTAHVLELVRLAQDSDYDIDVQAIRDTISEATQRVASVLVNNISKAANGTISASELTDLQSSLNVDVSKYTQATVDGYKISSEGMLEIGAKMMEQYSDTYNVAKEMFDIFVGDSGIYKSYRELVKAAEALNDESKRNTKEYQAQKRLLKEMARIAAFDPNDPLFNFMSQDPARKMADTAESMIGSIEKVKSTFKSLTDGENISATDFYNMMDFMYEQLGGWENLVDSLGLSSDILSQLEISTQEGANAYEQFVNAIVSQSKILGEVDSSVLLDLGISAESMSEGMSKSLEQVAKDQIKQLEAIKSTLLAFKQLEDLDIDLSPISTVNGEEVFLSNFTGFLGLDSATDKKIIEAVNDRLGIIKQALTDAGINTGEFWQDYFGIDGVIDAENTAEHIYAQNLEKFLRFLETTENADTIIQLAKDVGDINLDGAIDFADIFDFALTNSDWDKYAEGISNDIHEKIAATIQEGINGVTSLGNGKYQLAEGVNLSEAITKQIVDAYSKEGFDAIEIDANGQEISVQIIDANVKAAIDKSAIDWKFDFDSQSYKASVEVNSMEIEVEVDKFGSITYNKNGKEINDSDITNWLNEKGGLNIGETTQSGKTGLQLIPPVPQETIDSTNTVAQNVEEIKNTLKEGLVITVDSESAKNNIEQIAALYSNLATTLSNQPMMIAAEGISTATIQQVEKDADKQELPTLVQKVEIEWDKESMDAWKQQNLIQPIQIAYSGIYSYRRDNLVQTVNLVYNKGVLPPLVAPSSPNKNEVQGPIKRDSKAKGTLMGELGPEIYVQNGSYHVAGAHGPEFVKLRKDAIVFNHIQSRNLLLKGKTSKTGKPITNERNATSMATGNVKGPAAAGGIDSAIAAIDRAIAIWQNILNSTTADLLNSSGKHKGGGSGNTLKAVTEELQEWYNLTRQIADIEQEINNLLAERENIEWSNGEEYLKNLREQQKLLRQQVATQQALLDYQELQLKRQADHINQNRIWSQFLTVGQDGLLQYTVGNETNGGKGALQVLQELNQMSGQEQTDFLKKLGYSYTDNDGNKLEGTELVEKFYEELQAQIDQYDSLYDTVHGTKETLEGLQTTIDDINDQIRDNQMELEEEIFNIIVESMEKEIEVLEEQADLIEEANDAYVKGLNEALSAERKLYDDNEKIADREQLQRQLSLLRRSGGSAAEIADLEQQLDSMLKEEYFSNQERMIEEIQKANDNQVQQLQTQIKLQEESLEYQKEHGIIWNEVYRVMSQSKDEILAFMQGNNTTFFSQSLLMQEQMLTDWAHKIGIYTEDKKYQNFAQHAQKNLWDNGQAWNIGELGKYQQVFNSLEQKDQQTIRDQFTSVYAQARLDGETHEKAAQQAAEAVAQTLKRKQEANNSANNKPPVTNPNPQGGGGNNGGNSEDGSGSSGGGSSSSPTHWTFTYNGKKKKCYSSEARARSAIESLYNSDMATIGSYPKKSDYATAAQYQAALATYNGKKKTFATRKQQALSSLRSGKHVNGYSEGGLVDYTGVAIVHGKPGKPESFLNAEQTAEIREGLKESGKGETLKGIKNEISRLNSSIRSITNVNNRSESNDITIAPGAVVIQVEQLNDSYDVDTLSADVLNRIYEIGNKSTSRSVNRR